LGSWVGFGFVIRSKKCSEGGYWPEKDEKHQMFISLQLSDSSERPERFALPTWFVTRGRNLLELAGTEKNAAKINKLLQAGANYLPFPLHFFFPISRRFAELV